MNTIAESDFRYLIIGWRHWPSKTTANHTRASNMPTRVYKFPWPFHGGVIIFSDATDNNFRLLGLNTIDRAPRGG